MLKKTQVTELIDDIDGTPATTSVNFSVGGTQYVIDLSEANLAEFQAALAPYIKHGRRAVARKPRGVAGRAKRQNAAEIRAWGIEKGYLKSTRGRLGQTVIDAYQAAHKER
jgi:hypothetical protein